jgi:hypothetical protein
MTPWPWPFTLDCVDLVLAMSPTGKCVSLLLFTGIAAPLAGILFRRVAGGWDSIGGGALAIDQDLPLPRYLRSPERAVDPAIQAAEVRQMLEARADRLQRRGERSIDVGAEAARLLAKPAEEAGGGSRQEAILRAEVRQLIVTRNERRMRKGLQPLDVEAETERQLADFVGSR